MKIKSIFAIVAAAATVLFAGCDPKEPDLGAAAITLKSDATINLASAESSQTVKFVATRNWTASVSENAADWIAVTPASGKASAKEQSVSIDVLANAGKDRMGTVTISILQGSTVLGSKTITVNQEGEQGSSYITIAALREQAPTGEEVVNIAEGTMVKGVVLSNVDLNNLTSKKIVYLQDETAGVQIFFDANSTFKRGEEISVDLTGASLKLYSGQLEVEGAKLQNASKTGDATLAAKTVTMADFLANKYEAQYVALEGVQVAKADIGKTWVQGGKATSVNFEDAEGNTFVVRSSQYSSYKDETVPSGSGTIKGISSFYNGTLQLLFTVADDYAGLTGERIEPAFTETTIAAVLAGSVTGGAIVDGAVVAAGKTSYVINDGGEKNLYVYVTDKEAALPAVGKVVTVTGTVAKYGATELIQLTDATFAESTKTITPASQTPKALDAAAVDAYNGNWSELVTVTGKLKKSGNYFNIEIGSSRVGSVVATTLTDALTDGAIYDFTGYFGGVSGTSTYYFNILPTEIKESAAPNFEVAPTAITVTASTTSAKFNVKGNCAWTASSDNADFVLSATSGTGEAEVTVTFPENTSTESTKVANIKVSTTAEVSVKEYTVVITQGKKSSTGEETAFVKVTAAPSDWAGTYLIVNEDEKVAFDGKGTADAAALNIAVTISDNKIAADASTLAATVTFEKMTGGYAVKTASGKYLSGTSGKNTLNFGDSQVLNEISLNSDGTAEIVDKAADTHFRYNADNGQKRFRYYKKSSTSVKNVYLYKLTD